MLLRYDYSNMTLGRLGKEAVSSAVSGAAALRAKIFAMSGDLGFLETVSSGEISAVESLAKKYRKNFETLLVIGIGGSELGTKAIYESLAPRFLQNKKRSKGGPMKLVFLGNTDPEEIAEKMQGINLKKTIVNVVSKSGGTAEILANFFLVRQMLERAVGKGRAAERIVATTDQSFGLLRKMADETGWATLPIPKNIGGRFSSLTAVGLFPASCAGINIRELVSGSRKVLLEEKNGKRETPALIFAVLQYLAFKNGMNISVLMPYSASLYSLAFWYRQLWAESLGKTKTTGSTPVAALGAVDQHSQLQLYAEGPEDKTVTFLEVGRFRKNFQVPTYFKDRSGALSVQGCSFEEIIHAERSATAFVLSGAGRPNGTIFIPAIKEDSIGALLQFFMMAASYAGSLFGVDAFNQPGVESMKKELVEILGQKKEIPPKGESVSY